MLKYSLGIDISKADFHTTLSVIDQQQKVTVKATRRFSNNPAGFAELHTWIVRNHKQKELLLKPVWELQYSSTQAAAIHKQRCRQSPAIITIETTPSPPCLSQVSPNL